MMSRVISLHGARIAKKIQQYLSTLLYPPAALYRTISDNPSNEERGVR